MGNDEWEQEFRKNKPFRILANPDIAARRRFAYSDADAKYKPLLKKINKARNEAYGNLALIVWSRFSESVDSPPDQSIDRNDPEIRRLWEAVDKAEQEFRDTYLELQCAYEDIEEEFDRQTHQYFTTHPAIKSEG
jgi:hypothetical protein